MKKLRNILLSGAMATTLTACGGGGSGGAIGSVSNFVQDDLSSLTGSESIINSYSSFLLAISTTSVAVICINYNISFSIILILMQFLILKLKL